MRRALRLAERGRGRVNPNPMVGAVVVRRGRIVGQGWHRAAGRDHAEVEALRRAGSNARGATMYVTLEPCAHTGRTPPCVDAIVRAGIRRCVVALRDPHRVVDGRGLRRLRGAGIAVEVGSCADEVSAMLAGYLMTHERGRPRVTLKLATSLDGRIAPPGGFHRTGAGRWLTGPEARRAAHGLRARSDAIVIGAGTARQDDPRLTARLGAGTPFRQPLRVVCDTELRLPRTLRVFGSRLARGTVVACGPRAPRRRQAALEDRGVRVWRLPSAGGGVSARALLSRLGREGCFEVMVEGGATLATSWLDAGVIDRVALFVAPQVLGARGLSWSGALRLGRRYQGRIVELGRAGRDVFLMVEGS